VWIKALVTSVDTTAVCTDINGTTYEATRMVFNGQTATFLADTVRAGAPMRDFTRFTYGLMEYDGNDYLGRSENGGDWSPLVGPLTGVTGRPGLEFEYLDGDGNTATAAEDVAQVTITIRSHSRVVDKDGAPVVDSLTSTIYMRN
jgi:hypothetical protein